MRTRIVLDANIYVSTLIKPSSPPGMVFRHLVENHEFELVISEDILNELKRVLFYPKVRKYIKKSDHDIQMWLDALVVQAFLPTIRFSYKEFVKDDPDDDIYIIAALESKAPYLISGDGLLLKLRKYQQVKILTSAEFLHGVLNLVPDD